MNEEKRINKLMNQSFSFRKRIGQLNWKQISSVDIESMIQEIKIPELQLLLDTITFSEVSLQDLKQNNIGSIQLLIQIMQLTIEYLLYHQEQQYATIHTLQKKISTIKSQRDSFQQQNISYQEDIKTYKRQLHILRKALNGKGVIKGSEDLLHAEEKHGARIIYPLGHPDENQPPGTSTKEIIKTLIQHEQDARKLMSNVLEEQRKAFHQEIVMVVDSFRQMQQQSAFQAGSNPNQSQQMTNSFQLLMENMKLQFQTMLQSIQPTVETKSSTATTHSSHTAETLKAAAMQALQEELSRKERTLAQREEALRRKEELLRQQSSETSTSNQLLQQRKHVKATNQFASSMIFFNTMTAVMKRLMSRSFHHWHRHTIELRHQEYDEEQQQQLLYAATHPSSRETELQKLYDNEREKAIVLQAKVNHFQRELEACKQTMEQAIQQQQEKSSNRQELSQQLKQSQEKSIILSAKLNTLTTRYEKEKQELLLKIEVLEKMIADITSQGKGEGGTNTSRTSLSSPPRRIYYDAATNISKDFSLGLSTIDLPSKASKPKSEIGVGDSIALPRILEEDLGSAADEYDLLDHAMARINAKTDKQSIEQLAIATLTQEFLTKFQSNV